MLSSRTNALLTHTLASFWMKQSCPDMARPITRTRVSNWQDYRRGTTRYTINRPDTDQRRFTRWFKWRFFSLKTVLMFCWKLMLIWFSFELCSRCIRQHTDALPGCASNDLSHKSHNAPVTYPLMHHFVTEMCTLLQNGALWDICLMHCGICEMNLLYYSLKQTMIGRDGEVGVPYVCTWQTG